MNRTHTNDTRTKVLFNSNTNGKEERVINQTFSYSLLIEFGIEF